MGAAYTIPVNGGELPSGAMREPETARVHLD